MSLTGGTSAGSLLVEITPDTTRFASALASQAEQAARGVDVGVEIDPDTSNLLARLNGELNRLDGKTDLSVDVDPNVSGLGGEVKRAAELATAATNIDVDVDPDVRGLATEVNRAAELATAGVSIDVPVRPSVTGLAAQTAAQGQAAGTVAGAGMARSMGASLMRLAGPLAAAGGAAAGVAFAKGSVDAASDLGETRSKALQIFGPEAFANIEQFSSTASTALGQTQQQALDAAATFGIFGKAAGLQKDELSGFSSDLVSLATDMASFGNTSVEEAINSIGGALRGESEPIRKYGVMLTADAVAAKALELNLVKTNVNMDKVRSATEKVKAAQKDYNLEVQKHGKESAGAGAAAEYLEFKQQELSKALAGTAEKLTPQAKVLATNALLYEQTADTQGDFQRTSEGLANQQRILAAQWGDMKTKIGGALLPVITKVVTKFNEWLPKIAAFGGQVADFLAPVRDVFANLFGGDGADGPASKLGEYADAVRGMWETIQPIIADLVAGFRAAWDTIGPQVKEAFESVQGIVSGALGVLAEIIAKITGTIRIIWEKWGVGITKFVTKAFQLISKIVSGALKALSGAINLILAVLKGDWSKAWDSLKQVVSGVWDAITGIIELALRGIMATLDGLWALFKTAGVNIVKGLWSGISSLAGWIGEKVGGFFRGLLDGLPSIVKKMFGIDDSALEVVVPKVTTDIPVPKPSRIPKPSSSPAYTSPSVPRSAILGVSSTEVNQTVTFNNYYPKPETVSDSAAMQMRRAAAALGAA